MQQSPNHPLKEFYSDIHGSYDRINRIFTFGRDAGWRRKAARECLSADPDSVLDVCTGTGDFLFEISRQSVRERRLAGYDFSREMLDVAERKNISSSYNPETLKLEFIQGDVSDMPFKESSFEAMGITFGIRNLLFENPNADRHLSEMRRVLAKGGRLVILESSKPANRIWRFINSLYLRFILPYLGGLISGNFKAYHYLARSSRNYYTIGEMEEILESAGLTVIKGIPLFMGSVMLVVAEKK